MEIKRTPKGFSIKQWVYPWSWSPENEARRFERSVRHVLRELGVDPDPEETSRRALIYQGS